MKIVKEFFAIVLWLFVITKLFIFDVDIFLAEKFIPSYRWILNYRFFALLLLIAILLVLIDKDKSRKFFCYIAGYPFIVLWRVIKLTFRNWAILIAFVPAFYELFGSFRFRFILASLAAIAGLSILLFSNMYILVLSMIILGFFLAAHLYRNLRRAYRTSVFAGLAEVVAKFRLSLESGDVTSQLWKKVEYDPESEKSKKEYEEQLSNFYVANWAISFVAEKLYSVAKSRKPDLYLMFALLGTILITSIIYAFEYWALYKIDSNSFSPASGLYFWSFWGYSFGKLAPSGISTIQPVSFMATFISYSEIVCAIIIFVILVFSILTAAREKYREDIDDFIRELKKLGNAAEHNFLVLFNLAITDVELILIRSNKTIVNDLRKLRGLPPLPITGTEIKDSQTKSGSQEKDVNKS